jgi:acetyl-CoA C-acetyltransferase
VNGATVPVHVASAVRTPIGRFLGGLSTVSAVGLGTLAAQAAIARAGIRPGEVETVIFGNARQAGVGPNPARQIGVASGVPASVPAYTINMACASGLKAIELGAQEIATGGAEVVLVGGTESMSNVPFLVDGLRTGHKLGSLKLVDAMYRDGFLCRICDQIMGATAENLVDHYGIRRDEQDAYALESQRRAQAAMAEDRFREEMVAVEIGARDGATRAADRDEHPRPDTTLEGLRALKSVFRSGGTVTAGNSSGIVDGAAALVLVGERVARELAPPSLGRIGPFTSAGVEPAIMGIGPVPAVRRLLERTGLELADIDLIELNEAFAAQVLAVDRELHFDRARLNVLGGAIALGHPIGASGARIVVTLVHEMRRRDARYGLATLCVSGGQGMAALVTR